VRESLVAATEPHARRESTMRPLSPRSAVRAAAAALGLATVCAVRGVAAEGDPYVYTLNNYGKLSVNGTVIDDLPGAFDFDGDDVDHLDEAWVGLAVEGSDRYALRYDGLVRKNGKKLFELPYGGFRWVGIAVENGTVFCLTADGVLAVDDDIVGDLAMEGYGFLALAVHDGRIYSLRSDGQVFRDADREDFIRFAAGPGRASLFPDGWAVDTLWSRIAVDPTGSGRLIALRTDGHLYGAPLSGIDPTAAEIAELPFFYDYDADDDGDTDEYPVLDDIYTDLEVSETGSWWVLAADGRVFNEDRGALIPVGDLPDQPDEETTLYYDLAVRGTDYWVVRNDGKVYFDGETPPILQLPGTSYGRVAVSTALPDTSSIDEHPPKATILHTRTIVGTPLEIPAIVSDTETATADLVVTPTSIPADTSGSTAVWDGAARVLRWDAPQVAGEYKFKFDVTDAKTTDSFVYVIEVLHSHEDDPAENTAPRTPTITGARAIVGQPYVLPIVVDDKDRDVVTVTVDRSKYPYTGGATFDDATHSFAWTPTAEDKGDVKLKFEVSDGVAEKSVEFVLKVKNALTSPTGEHPPQATILHTRTVVGTPLEIPAVVTDAETATADLVVTPVQVPSDATGSTAVWDPAARVLRWDAPRAAGEYKFKFDVSDGSAAVRAVYVIEVADAVDPAAENKGPSTPTITEARAIVGQPFSLPIIVDDKDHDALQVAVDLEDYPYTAGATFDKATNTFAWTPRAENQGEVTLKFKVSDGYVEKKLEVALTVKNGLIF
jgi:putative Ig domain-containing protein